MAEVKAWSERAKVLPEAMAYAAAETAASGTPATVAVTFDPNVWAPVGGFTVGGKGYTFTAVPGGFAYKDIDRKPKRKRVRVRVPDPMPVLEALFHFAGCSLRNFDGLEVVSVLAAMSFDQREAVVLFLRYVQAVDPSVDAGSAIEFWGMKR